MIQSIEIISDMYRGNAYFVRDKSQLLIWDAYTMCQKIRRATTEIAETVRDG